MTKEAIEGWNEKTIRRLVENYDKLGLRASGDWERSLEGSVKVTQDGIKTIIKGNDYTLYLERGRKPNKNQDYSALKKWVGWAVSTFLKKWMKDKGLQINPFAVAWKIAKEGVKVPNTYNKGGLVSDVITESVIQELLSIVGNEFLSNVKSDVINDIDINNTTRQ